MDLEAHEETFVEGFGMAAGASGVLTPLQGRIYALLYLRPDPMSLDDLAQALEQSKSGISVNVRGLVEWHLVRLVRIPGSRRDHYEAATDFWRVLQAIMERRFRWIMRQVVASAEEARRAAGRGRFVAERLDAMAGFAQAVDALIESFSEGEAVTPATVRRPPEPIPIRSGRRRR